MKRIHHKALRSTLAAALVAPALLLGGAPASAVERPIVLAYAPTAAVRITERHVTTLKLKAFGIESATFADLKEAAEAGYAPAMRRLGEIYDNGTLGVRRDFLESVRWYHRARLAGERIQGPHTVGLGLTR